MDKGKPFMHVSNDVAPYPEEINDIPNNAPTFSEAVLYPTLGKDDARFVLGVAEEYEHVIEALGPKAVRSILDVKPRLVQRLGLGERVVEELADANSDEFERREAEFPSQVVIDDNAAEAIWKILHGEYRRLFNPEEDMDKDHLRTYHYLTDRLGRWEQDQRKKEQDRLPEKLATQAARKSELVTRREARDKIREALGEDDAALKLFNKAFA